MTLFERIGGDEAVSQMIDAFYGRIFADPELRPFFVDTMVERLTHMQKVFFAAALDGPNETSGVDIARTHQDLGIRREHLTRFADHLIAVLDERHSIQRRDAMDIVFRIATYGDQVIGEPGGADG